MGSEGAPRFGGSNAGPSFGEDRAPYLQARLAGLFGNILKKNAFGEEHLVFESPLREELLS